MPRNHCSDEILLAHIDGELGRLASWMAARHLKNCWDCRARQAELERQAEAVARILHEDSFPGAERVEAARDKFLEWQRRIRVPPGRQPLFIPYRSRWVLAAATALVLCAAGVALWRRPSPVIGHPEAVLARIKTAEGSIGSKQPAVHQVFRIEIAERKPEARSLASRLEVYSDPSGERYVSRWTDLGGTLKHAVWRPEPGSGFLYAGTLSASADPAPARVLPLARLASFGFDAGAIEKGFMAWLANRSWRPVSLSAELAILAGEDGTVLKGTRVRSDGAGPAIRLSARRERDGFTVEIDLEVDVATYLPRLEKIRFETAGMAVEFSIEVERAEGLSEGALLPGLFAPPPGIRQAAPRPSASGIPAPLPGVSITRGRPAPAELERTEVETRYALHRAGACLGEPIEVAHDADSVRVGGLVRNAARRSELTLRMSMLPGASLVVVDLQTPDEAVSRRAGRPLPEPPSSGLVTRVPERPNPLQKRLRAYLARGGDGSATQIDKQINDLSNRAVSISESALAEAWAIRRLGEQYPKERAGALHPQTQRLIEVMARDHVRALQSEVDSEWKLVGPVLGIGLPHNPAMAPERTTDWRRQSMVLFAAVERFHALIQSLFAGGGPEVDPLAVARELAGVVPRIDANARAVETLAANEFPGREAPASSNEQQ